MKSASQSQHDRVLRKNDFGALFALFFGTLFVVRGQMLEMTKETGPAMIALSALGLIFVVVLPLVYRGLLASKPAGEDEYLRKLLIASAASGFYITFAAFVVWVPLTGTLFPAPSAPQLIGVMLIGASMAWFVMRWRDAH